MLCVQSLSHVRLCVAPWTVVRQAPLPMEFSRQEYWNGLLLPPPEDLPDPGIKSASSAAPALQADSLPLSQQGSPMLLTLSLFVSADSENKYNHP